MRLIYLKVFFKWCVEENIFKFNFLEGFFKKKVEGWIVNIDIEILEKFLKLFDKNIFCGLCDYVLILFIFDIGIRLKEVFLFLIEYFDFKML